MATQIVVVMQDSDVCKILFLEDQEQDVELMRFELKLAGLKNKSKRVSTKNDFLKVIEEFIPDIILADYNLPSFNGMHAFKLFKELQLTIPFILVTGSLDESLASECLNEGIDDFLLKSNFKKLPALVKRQLEVKQIEREKINAIEALRKSENELKTLFDSIDEVFFSMDIKTNKLTQISSACEKVYGYTKAEFLNDIDLWKKRIHPEDEHIILNTYSRLLSGEIVVTENRILRADNETRWVQTKVIPHYDEQNILIGLNGVIGDITERKKNEQALLKTIKNLSDYKWALDSSCIVSIADNKGKITYANQKFCEISKYSPAELYGNDHAIINSGYHPKSFMRNLWQTIASGKVWNGEIKNKAKDGTYYWVNTTITPFLDESGIPYQYISIRSDITQRKESENQLANKCQELQHYIYKTSHDLRSPSCSAQGLIQLMKSEFKDEQLDSYLDKLEFTNKKILALIDSLNLAHVITDKSLQIDFIDLSKVLSEIISELNFQPEAVDVQFEVSIDFEEKIFSDQSLIVSIFQNLLQNAVLYKSIQRTPKIIITAHLSSNQIHVTVSDNGKGIPAENQSRVFDMFYRGDHDSKGTGLGLYIVKRAIEKLNGTIILNSSEEGTEFKFSLPLNR